jgi:hypothetical protein
VDRITNEPLAPLAARGTPTVESAISAVSWGSIIAGAVVASSVSIVMMALASGLGLASVSPWPEHGASLTTFTALTAIGLIVVQWLSSAVGGYITGRLRTKWTGTHTHEVFFRDTAHGFISWSLSTVMVASILAAAASSFVQAGAQGAAAAAPATVNAYTVDTLFRPSNPEAPAESPNTGARAETTRILTRSISTGDVSASDRAYLSKLIAARTGASETDAQKRVDDAIAQVKADADKAREAADAARKASSAASIFTALSMAVGAFIASISAALGGRLRDEHP